MTSVSTSPMIAPMRDGDEAYGWSWFKKAQAERGIRGWTYSDLASRIKDKGINVSNWLRGRHNAPGWAIQRIAAAFGWPTEYLSDPNVPYPPPLSDDYFIELCLRTLGPGGRRIVAALVDPAKREFIATQLDLYERMLAETRGAGAPRRGNENGNR